MKNSKDLTKTLKHANNNTAIKKVKRRIVDWLFKYAHDEETYEIANAYNIKNNTAIKKVKRRIVDWLFKYAHDEETYEIANAYNIKID